MGLAPLADFTETPDVLRRFEPAVPSENRTRSPQRPTRRRLATEDYQALGAFRNALRRFMAFSEAGSRDLGLTPQQHQALLAVRAHPDTEPMTVSALADVLMIKNHSAVGLVERLVERELMTRSPSPHDRRRVELTLTDLGRRKLEAISRNNLGQLQTSIPVFTDLMHALEQLELPAPEAAPATSSPADAGSPEKAARRPRRKPA